MTIEQIEQKTTTISVESPEAFEKTLKSLNDFSERFDLGATASASVSASLSFYPVEKKASPLVDNHYDLGVDSAYVQLTWDEKPVGTLGYTIRLMSLLKSTAGSSRVGTSKWMQRATPRTTPTRRAAVASVLR